MIRILITPKMRLPFRMGLTHAKSATMMQFTCVHEVLTVVVNYVVVVGKITEAKCYWIGMLLLVYLVEIRINSGRKTELFMCPVCH